MEHSTATARTYARTAGFLYLLIIVGAGFAQGVVRSGLVVPGDPVTTGSNVAAAETLFRLGLAADVVAFLADAAVAVLLYVLLRPVSRTLSLLAAAFRLVGHPAIASVNLLNHVAALLLLNGTAPLAGFGPEQAQSLALLALDLHRYGYLIGGAFFGVHCALLGYLLIRSPRFPSALGVLLGAAAVGYLAETFTVVLLPAHAALASGLVVVTAGVGEVTLCLWLLVKGVRDIPVAARPGG